MSYPFVRVVGMDAHDYAAALVRDGRRMADAADGALDRPVGSCPGWTVADLVWHTGEVHAFWRGIADGAGPDGYEEPPRPPDGELVAWFRRQVEELAAALEAADPAAPAWTWSDRKDVGFIQRRMAHETAVHCWDALAAVGRDEPVEPVLAADGIDEFLQHFLPGRPEHVAGPLVTVHLHATDGDGEWLIRAGEGSASFERAHGKGDAAARGPVSDLLLLLWGRRRPDDLEVFGDRAALDTFLGRVDRS